MSKKYQQVSTTAEKIETIMVDLQRVKESVELQEGGKQGSNIPDSARAVSSLSHHDEFKRHDTSTSLMSQFSLGTSVTTATVAR